MALITSLLLALIVAALTLSPIEPGAAGIEHLDKLAHFLAFAAICAPLAWHYPGHWRAVALAGLAYGGMIEIVQPHVGRSAEWADLAADGLGALAGACLAVRARRWRRARREKPSKG